MTKEKLDALLGSCIGYQQGAKPTAPMTAREVEDMQILGFLGNKGGLTLKGSIRAERLKNDIPF